MTTVRLFVRNERGDEYVATVSLAPAGEHLTGLPVNSRTGEPEVLISEYTRDPGILTGSHDPHWGSTTRVVVSALEQPSAFAALCAYLSRRQKGAVAHLADGGQLVLLPKLHSAPAADAGPQSVTGILYGGATAPAPPPPPAEDGRRGSRSPRFSPSSALQPPAAKRARVAPSRWGPIREAEEELLLNRAARALDSAEEDKALRGCSTAAVVHDGLRAAAADTPRAAASMPPEPEAAGVPPEASWLFPRGGPTADGALPREALDSFIERMQHDSDAAVPIVDAVHLLRHGSRGFRDTGALRRLSAPPGGAVVLVGDTHGQLADVWCILMRHGLPSSARRVYLVNGDVADRGAHAVEILFLLLAFKLHDPGSVFINRGNHEDDYMNEEYGFRDEVVRKYGRLRGQELYAGFQHLFNGLPLCSVVDAGDGGIKVFVAHGGLPRQAGCTLADIAAIPIKRPIPSDTTSTPEAQIFFDLLWSDPQPQDGVGSNERGSRVMAFGPDVTKAFLATNGPSLVTNGLRACEFLLPHPSLASLALVFLLEHASGACCISVHVGTRLSVS